MELEFDAQQILQEALESYMDKKNIRHVDITNIARRCGLSYSNVYHPLMNGRRCNTTIWFKLMWGLGALKADNSGYHISQEA